MVVVDIVAEAKVGHPSLGFEENDGAAEDDVEIFLMPNNNDKDLDLSTRCNHWDQRYYWPV